MEQNVEKPLPSMYGGWMYWMTLCQALKAVYSTILIEWMKDS